MKQFRKYLIAIGAVTLWAVFSYAYLGVEDGSSGLGILGLIMAFFVIPGGILFHVIKHSHTNADIPVIVGISWLVYVLVIVLVIKCVCVFRKFKSQRKSGEDNGV